MRSTVNRKTDPTTHAKQDGALMLILTRKPGQVLKTAPLESVNPATPIGELFRDGPIEIVVTKIQGTQVRLGINAHASFLVLRDELTDPRAELVTIRRRSVMSK